MRTNRLMIEAVAWSSLQTAGQHISDSGSDSCSANAVAIQVTNFYLFKCSWYGHRYEHQFRQGFKEHNGFW